MAVGLFYKEIYALGNRHKGGEEKNLEQNKSLLLAVNRELLLNGPL